MSLSLAFFSYLTTHFVDHKITRNFLIFIMLLLEMLWSISLVFSNVNSVFSRPHQSTQLIYRQCLFQLLLQFTTLLAYTIETEITLQIKQTRDLWHKQDHWQVALQNLMLSQKRSWASMSQRRKNRGQMKDMIGLQSKCGWITRQNYGNMRNRSLST